MVATIQTPLTMVESIAGLRFPPKIDRHLQHLMDRNNDGALTPREHDELEALVELSETISLVRAQALALLAQ